MSDMALWRALRLDICVGTSRKALDMAAKAGIFYGILVYGGQTILAS
jgi:hypothetical protein